MNSCTVIGELFATIRTSSVIYGFSDSVTGSLPALRSPSETVDFDSVFSNAPPFDIFTASTNSLMI